jgi:hypothetical protein
MKDFNIKEKLHHTRLTHGMKICDVITSCPLHTHQDQDVIVAAEEPVELGLDVNELAVAEPVPTRGRRVEGEVLLASCQSSCIQTFGHGIGLYNTAVSPKLRKSITVIVVFLTAFSCVVVAFNLLTLSVSQ